MTSNVGLSNDNVVIDNHSTDSSSFDDEVFSTNITSREELDHDFIIEIDKNGNAISIESRAGNFPIDCENIQYLAKLIKDNHLHLHRLELRIYVGNSHLYDEEIAHQLSINCTSLFNSIAMCINVEIFEFTSFQFPFEIMESFIHSILFNPHLIFTKLHTLKLNINEHLLQFFLLFYKTNEYSIENIENIEIVMNTENIDENFKNVNTYDLPLELKENGNESSGSEGLYDIMNAEITEIPSISYTNKIIEKSNYMEFENERNEALKNFRLYNAFLLRHSMYNLCNIEIQVTLSPNLVMQSVRNMMNNEWNIDIQLLSDILRIFFRRLLQAIYLSNVQLQKFQIFCRHNIGLKQCIPWLLNIINNNCGLKYHSMIDDGHYLRKFQLSCTTISSKDISAICLALKNIKYFENRHMLQSLILQNWNSSTYSLTSNSAFLSLVGMLKKCRKLKYLHLNLQQLRDKQMLELLKSICLHNRYLEYLQLGSNCFPFSPTIFGSEQNFQPLFFGIGQLIIANGNYLKCMNFAIEEKEVFQYLCVDGYSIVCKAMFQSFFNLQMCINVVYDILCDVNQNDVLLSDDLILLIIQYMCNLESLQITFCSERYSDLNVVFGNEMECELGWMSDVECEKYRTLRLVAQNTKFNVGKQFHLNINGKETAHFVLQH